MTYDYEKNFPQISNTIHGMIGVHHGYGLLPRDPEKAVIYLKKYYTDKLGESTNIKSKNKYSNMLTILDKNENIFYAIFNSFSEKQNKVTESGDKYYKTKNWEKKRKKIIKRDGGLCIECGSSKNLQVHHNKYLQISNEDKDCSTLCLFCHAKKHKINGRKMIENWMLENNIL